jgi:potassium-dependent mechanosensitive channel
VTLSAERCASHLTAAAGAFGLAVFLKAVHRTLGAPAAPMIATGELLAVAVLGITLHFLWRSAEAGADHADTDPAGAAGQALAWLRGILWIAAAALAAPLATGYVGFAVFLAGRLLATLAIAGAIAILVVFIDALLTELLAADTPHGRRIAALFGLSPRGLELAEMLLSAMLRLVLIVLAALLAVGYSGVFAEDIFGLFQRVTFDHVIGGVSLSPLAILSALAFLVIGGLAVRGAQRWLQTRFLPRTGLDAGLQNSISALFGYAALLAVLAFSLAVLGIDLQKIALIAGALSVGIGFGLQSVVSNFVCGLILLAERPVRVGDWVVVRNEEGWVRRISVRATEIETFDRASVIIPNQEFITGVVKNWTHGNTMGRIIIKVRVAYDSDLKKVRETLLACAAGHPLVLQAPPPAVYLMGFGDIGIDHELRCLLGNVEQFLLIRSDVQTDIARKFAEAGIKIPYPPHEARPPGRPPAGAASGTG